MKVAVPFAKNVLAPLEMMALASSIDAGIQMKIRGSGMTTLIITNKEVNDMMKIIKAFDDSGVLLKDVTKTIKNKTKKQRGGLLEILLGSLGASLLGNMPAGKGIVIAGYGNKKLQNGQGIVRASYGSRMDF